MPWLRDRMNIMDTLPTPASSGNTSTHANTTPQSTGGISSKEKEEFGAGVSEAPGLKEFGREAPLSQETTAAGVTLHPTSVAIPPPVAKLGVKPVGDTSTGPGNPAVTLPLTDDQIAIGLHKSITTSWRWLAEWCKRRLGQLHVAIKKVHGKFIEVKT